MADSRYIFFLLIDYKAYFYLILNFELNLIYVLRLMMNDVVLCTVLLLFKPSCVCTVLCTSMYTLDVNSAGNPISSSLHFPLVNPFIL